MSGSYLTIFKIKFLFAMVCTVQTIVPVFGQVDSLSGYDPIQVIARPSPDSIALRWAPLETKYWLAANKQGYTIERYTLVRDNKVLTQPEKKVLTPSPIKPYTEMQWEPVVRNNKYAAIAAQALLGETFELDMKQGNAFSIVNKVRENDQRFSIALFCADLSLSTAQALGVYYVDKEVKKGEKYLYRVVSTDARSKTIMGSAFVSPDQDYDLPEPKEFSTEVKGQVVLMQWDQSYHKKIYTAYHVERSEDGTHFTSVFKDPVTTLSTSAGETRFQYANDTLQNLNKEYYYRVVGITPFGEIGLPSEVKKVIGKQLINELPHIISSVSIDNKTIDLTWEFPEKYNSLIDGFYMERASSPSGNFTKASRIIISSSARSFIDKNPYQVNYYRVIALTPFKEQLQSMAYYAQLIDSIPPIAPVDLKATIDESGNVSFSWEPNKEPDIYGYRVYRAYYVSEEFTQRTSEPIKQASFKDKVEVHALNDKVHYRIMAIDKNQNHSLLSEVLTVAIPDKIPPVTPVFLPIKCDQEGVALSWLPSSSIDVVKYDVYRQGNGKEWIRITSINANQDSIYKYVDTNLKNGESRLYTIIAVDEASLESAPSPAIVGQRIKRSIWPSVTMQAPQLDRTTNKVILKWSYNQDDVKLYQVYKNVDEKPLALYRSVHSSEFSDQLNPGTKYQYKVIAVFLDGSRSEMGDGVMFEF
jgi:fibronectin type 3 domain-containing protein